MNKYITLFLTSLIYSFIAVSLARAGSDSDQSLRASELSWDKSAGLATYTATLSANTGTNDSGGTITIFLRNTSPSIQALEVPSDSYHGFMLYTIGKGEDKKRLRQRTTTVPTATTVQERIRNELNEMVSNSGSVRLERIQPDELITKTISISGAEMEELKTRPLVFDFILMDLQTSKFTQILSAPKLLK